jgi:nodulation protein E
VRPPLPFANLRAWDAARTVSSQPCRPFDRDRNGLSLGEGGAVLLLETREAALARGATIYAELLGSSMNADGHHLMQPLAAGAANAMRLALQDASLKPEQVDYINAHGTGTLLNDATETEAIKSVFAPSHDRLLVSSTKSMHGHALGAAGAIEAVATILALHHGVAPPTVNHRAPDPACDLDIVANQARSAPLRYALSNSFAFGGLNAVLAFGRPS